MDDAAFFMESNDKLQVLVNEFGMVCNRASLIMIVGKSKTMILTRKGKADSVE